MRKAIGILVVILATIIGSAGIAGADTPDHTVRQGDTLWSLAGSGGWGYSCIQNVADGRIPDCDSLRTGQRIVVHVSEWRRNLIDLWFASVLARREPVQVRVSVPAPAPRPAPAVSGSSVWDRVAMCESSGNWSINTGNGYYGGLQFTVSSWQLAGGSGMPHHASREEQIRVAERLLDIQGWGAWPACSSRLGLR
jgi:LysM repeat protein